MAEANRSLSACLRCRKQKLKCGGPSRIPCDRCRINRAECVFTQPRASLVKSVPEQDERLVLLEQRLNFIEQQLRGEIRTLQISVKQLSTKHNFGSVDNYSIASIGGNVAPSTYLTAQSPTNDSSTPVMHSPHPSADIVSRGLITDDEWNSFYSFYHKKCRTVIAFVDDQLDPPVSVLRQHPLMSTVICAISARAIRPEKYQIFVDEADALICKTFQGLAVDLLGFYALMILTAWTGRARLWGYATSIAYDMKLNLSALQLSDDTVEKNEHMVESARAWFTLCCFDLIVNLSRPFAINRMKEYLPHSKLLLSSPYCRPVDHRICTYIDGFVITGDIKSRLQSSQLQTQPLSESIANLLTSYDERVDMWFHDINNKIDPLFQTFLEIQDRNRFMTPYAFMKLYINGLALHGAESLGDDPDPVRLEFIRKALASASLLIQTQWESHSFRQALRYTIDYNGTTIFHASRFILKVINVMPTLVTETSLMALRQASQVFEQAGAIEVANDLRKERDKIAVLTKIILSPEPSPEVVNSLPLDTLFDIPSFLDRPLWDNEFPLVNNYMME